MTVIDMESDSDIIDDVEITSSEEDLDEDLHEDNDEGSSSSKNDSDEEAVYSEEQEDEPEKNKEVDDSESDQESSTSKNDSDEEAVNLGEQEKNIETNGSESDKESIKDENDDFDIAGTNAGWADSVAKILRTNRTKGKKTLVLSKAKKLTDVVIREKAPEIGFQIDGEIKEEKPDLEILEKLKTEEEEPPKKRRKEVSLVRVKPHILEKDRERTLSKIATKGVVQLFNSVRMQHNKIDTELEKAGPLERKRENVMKNMDKRAFLDVLMRNKSQQVDGDVKNEKSDATWSVLRDDFMMGAKLKDWDKEMDEDGDDECVDDLSDSD